MGASAELISSLATLGLLLFGLWTFRSGKRETIFKDWQEWRGKVDQDIERFKRKFQVLRDKHSIDTTIDDK